MFDSVPFIASPENHLLSALSGGDYRSFQSHFETVALSRNQILDDGGANAGNDYAYFPLDAVISLVSTMKDAAAVELAMVGREGTTGIHRALGIEASGHLGIVAVPGKAFRIKTAALREQFGRNAVFSVTLTKYFHALHTQIIQAALCHRLHKAAERLQTWLTMMFNRAETDNLKFKHEEIARTLGYTRPTVSVVTARLQRQEIIRYRRGRIELLDRPRLEQSNCECYRIMESNYERAAPVAAIASLAPSSMTRENYD